MVTPRKDPRNPMRALDDIRSHKFRRIITEEWLRRRWSSDSSIYEIAQEAGCSTSTVRHYAQRFGFSPRAPRKREQGWDEVLTGEYLTAAYVEDRMTVEAIAADVGTTASTVVRWLAANDIPRRGHEPGVDNLLYEDVLTASFLALRLQQRASVNDIAREAGCTGTAVRNALRRHGLEDQAPTVRPPKPPCASPEELRSLYESGMSLEAMGVRLGVSRTKVRSDLSRFGIRSYSRPGFRLTDDAWAPQTEGSGSLAEKAPPTAGSSGRKRAPARPRTGSLPADGPEVVPGWAALRDTDRQILLVVDDHPVESPSGRAVARLQDEAGIDSRETVRSALIRLEGLGLLARIGNASRTHRLSITPAGAACVADTAPPGLHR